MLRLLRLSLATVYLTYVLCYGQIGQPVRKAVRPYRFLADLLTCPFCTGFWVALALVWLPQKALLVLAAAGANLIVWSLDEGATHVHIE